MKKIVYLLLAVSVIGGVAYVLTQTNFLSGNIYKSESDFVCKELTIDTASTVVAEEKDIDFTVNVSLSKKTASLFNPSYQKANIIDGSSLGAQGETGTTNIEITQPNTESAEPTGTISIPTETSSTSQQDSDGDKIPNVVEEQIGTDPNNADTDGDGVPDGAEQAAGTNPLEADQESTVESVESSDTTLMPWKGTLIIEAARTVEDEGFFIDPLTGSLAKELAIDISKANGLSVKIKYTGGNAGDVIRAYIKEEEEKCNDTIELTEEEAAQDMDGTDIPTEDEEVPEDIAPSTVYTCSELIITPEDTIVVKKNEDVEFDVKVKLNKPSARFFDPLFEAASLLTFNLPSSEAETETPSIEPDFTTTVEELDLGIMIEPTVTEFDWEGTLIIEAERTVPGKGTFLHDGKETNKIKLKINDKNTKFSFIYTGGNAGDIIRAYIEAEQICKDTLELLPTPKATDAQVEEEEEVVTEEEAVAACTLVDIQPDTYALPADETSMEFTVRVESSSSWIEDLTAFVAIDLASEDRVAFTVESTPEEWFGMLTLTSSNPNSIFFNETDKTLKSNPQSIAVSGALTEVQAKIKNVKEGDLITAYVEGEENCKDTLLLETETAVEEEVVSEEVVIEEEVITEEVVTEEEIVTEEESSDEETVADEEEDSTDTTSSSSSSSDNGLDTILASKDYVCSEPFNDADETDWFWSKACRLYRAAVFTGKDSDTLDPEGNLTRAEAIKVLMILSGKEGTGSGESYSDVTSNDWFYDYYVAAQEANIVRGTYANPNSPITRGDLMVYMVRTAEQTLYGWDESDIPFSDLSKSDYYTYAIIIGYNTIVDDPDTGTTRVFNGYSNGTSGATKYIARSEAMTLALRFYLAWYAN